MIFSTVSPAALLSSLHSWSASLQRAAIVAFIVSAVTLFQGPLVIVTITMSTTTGADAELFFAREGEGYSPDRRVPFAVTPDGRWRTYSVDIDGVAEIAKLRVDASPNTGTFAVRDLLVESLTNRASFRKKDLSRAVATTNRLIRVGDESGVLRFWSQGHDPYIDLVLPAQTSWLSPNTAFAMRALARGLGIGLALVLTELLVGLVWAWANRTSWAQPGVNAVKRALARSEELSRAIAKSLFFWLVASFVALGLCIAFTQPAFSVPDETMHWQVAHMRAERLLGDPDCVRTLPLGNSDRHAKNLIPYGELPAMQLDCIKPKEIYGDLLTYPGVLLSKLVLPRQQSSAVRQLQGVLVARVFQGLVFVFALARLGMLASSGAATGVLFVAAIANSPVLAQQTFSISADATQFCFAVSLCAVALFWRRLRWLDFMLFVVFGWGAAAKPFLLPCILPAVLAGYWYEQLCEGRRGLEVLREMAPTLRFSRSRLHGVFLWAGLGVTALFVLFALLEQNSGRNVTTLVANVDIKRQLLGLRSDPLKMPRLVLRDTLPWISDLGAYASPLGWLDTNLSPASVNGFKRLVGIALALEILSLVLARFSSTKQPEVGRSKSFLRIAVPVSLGTAACLLSILLIATILYLVWTPVGLDVVNGLQARYFLPTLIAYAGILGGAVRTYVQIRSCSRADPCASTQQSKTADPIKHGAAIALVAGALVLALTVPYITRVFIDLNSRYL